MKLILQVLVAATALSFTACASQSKKEIAKNVGCPGAEVRTIEKDRGFGLNNTTYRASCKGRQYICTGESCKRVAVGEGYLGQEELMNEKKHDFDRFLENLSDPDSSIQ